MLLNFKTIKIMNFMSFREAEVFLDNQGYTQVIGINNNSEDLAKNNGSGKSALFESIMWALTGETIRGTKQIVNKNSTDGTAVELTFSADNDLYKIIRYKEHKTFGTNLKIYLNDKDISGKGIRDSEKILEEYLPDLTASLLGSVVILGQGLPQRFTNNTPSGRKEILEKLSKSDFMIEDIKNKLSLRRAELNESLRACEDQILMNQSKKSVLESQLIQLKNTKASLIYIDYDTEIYKYQEELDKITPLQVDLVNELPLIQHNIDIKLEEYTNYNKSIESNLNNIDINLRESYHTKELEEEITHERVIKRALEDQITSLESIKDICPTCGQKLPDVHKVDTSDLHRQLDDLKTTLENKQTKLNKLLEDIKVNIANAKIEFNTDLDTIREEGNQLRKAFNDKNSILTNYNNQITDLTLTINKLKLNKETYENQSKTINSDILECETQIKKLEENILYNNIDKDNIKSHIDIVNKMITLASRDFRGFLLSGIINYINQRAKDYCQDIFETDKIDFKLNNNNIDITYCNKDYETLSGGEKQKVDIIIQFSIRDMMSKFLNFSSNILVLDEICDNCDALGCQKILDLIATKLSDISSIFIITHHTDIAISYDSELIIIKDESGNSTIK